MPKQEFDWNQLKDLDLSGLPDAPEHEPSYSWVSTPDEIMEGFRTKKNERVFSYMLACKSVPVEEVYLVGFMLANASLIRSFQDKSYSTKKGFFDRGPAIWFYPKEEVRSSNGLELYPAVLVTKPDGLDKNFFSHLEEIIELANGCLKSVKRPGIPNLRS